MSKQKIYIMTAGPYLKVGVAFDPNKRLLELQTGNPFDMKVALSMHTKGNAYDAEAAVHNKLSAFNTRGEWFDCSFEIAKRAVLSVADKNNKGTPRGSIRIAKSEIQAATKNGFGVELDLEKINSILSGGVGLKKEQAILLGMGYPIKRGWKKRLRGKRVPAITWKRLQELNR